jgi:hypothetical protein
MVLAAAGITTVNAGVQFGISLGFPLPVPTIVAPVPQVVAPAPVIVVPPMPALYVETVPVCPVPGYVWIGGSWGWYNNHWTWTRGHWGPPAHGPYWAHGFHGERHDGFHGHGRR